MGVLVTCKNEEDPFKNEGARVVTTDLRFQVYADFYDAQGKLTPQSEVGSIFDSNSYKLLMIVLVTCKNEKKSNQSHRSDVAAFRNHFSFYG